MFTNYIRFPDEQTGKSLLQEAGLYIPATESSPEYFKQADLDFALDVIGEITEGGEWNPETGEEITPPTTLPGWHVNYIGEVPEAWQEYIVIPQHPVRKFAGVD